MSAEDYAREAAAVIRPLADATERARSEARDAVEAAVAALSLTAVSPELESPEDVGEWAVGLRANAGILEDAARAMRLLAALGQAKLACWGVVAEHPAMSGPSAARPEVASTDV